MLRPREARRWAGSWRSAASSAPTACRNCADRTTASTAPAPAAALRPRPRPRARQRRRYLLPPPLSPTVASRVRNKNSLRARTGTGGRAGGRAGLGAALVRRKEGEKRWVADEVCVRA